MPVRILLAMLFCMPFSVLFSQVNDAGLWSSITVEKRILKNLDVVLTEEVRLNENVTEVGAFFTDIGAEYRLFKGFKAGIFYRHIHRRQLDDSYRLNNRLYADIAYRKKIKRFEIGYRIRFQIQYNGYRTTETGHIPELYLRQKLHFGYNTKSRFDPYLDGEIWYRTDPEWSRFDNVRITAGVITRITKKQSIDAGYLVNKEFNVVNPYTYYVLYLGYKLVL